MLDHVKFGVSDYVGSKIFFLKALEPLGIEAGGEGEPSYGIELCGRNNASLCLYQATEKPTPLHIAFTAETRQQVDAFYRAALEAGGKDNGAPGIRSTTTPTITLPLSSVRTDTISKRCVMGIITSCTRRSARCFMCNSAEKSRSQEIGTMKGAVKIIEPSVAVIESYKAALSKGWSPNTIRLEAAAEELGAISEDPAAFIESLTDLEARGSPIRMPDGSLAERLPGFIRWIWDGEFCGVIGFRWKPETEALPPHVLGHVGYSIVPWKQGKGYATLALSQLLEQVEFTGLKYISLTTDTDNRASQRVAEKCGAVFFEEFERPEFYGGTRAYRYRISLS